MATKRKKKTPPRVRRASLRLLLTGAAIVATAGYAGYEHLISGGSWKDLPAQIAQRAESIVGTPAATPKTPAPAPTPDPKAAATTSAPTTTPPAPASPPPAPSLPPAETGPAVRLFFAPTSSMNPNGLDDVLVAEIGKAQQSVLCAFYDLQLPSVATALIARHQAGVKVGIVSDTNYEDREAVQRCIRAGIPVTFDKRGAFMHNKFCVIDGRYVWTGSTNITENCMYRNDNNALLIRSVELAANYADEFDEMFSGNKFGARSPKNTPFPFITLGEVKIENYFAPEDGAQRQIIAKINGAMTSIDVMAFSFTSDPIAEAMIARLNKGVRVRALFEERNTGDKASEDKRLRDAGAKVYMDRNDFNMHNKVIILDNVTVITGSYNFSRNAEEQNDENLLILHDPGIAAQFTRKFEELIAL